MNWIAVLIAIGIIVIISMFIQIDEPTAQERKDTFKSVCMNTCEEIDNTAFSEYRNRVCYCQTITNGIIKAIYKDD